MVQLLSLVCFAVAFFEVCGALEQIVPHRSVSKSSIGSGRIVGGENANIHTYPYQLALTGSEYFCAASIISNNWALTAAHCVVQASITSMLLRAGSAYWNSEGTTYTVSQKIVHPSYNTPQFLDNDVALLKVATPFVYGCGINKIDLPTQGQAVPPGVVATSIGWGMTQTNGSMSLILQMVGISTISNTDCAAVYGAVITDSKVCAATQNKGVCQRDGGGPLVYNNQLIGVSAFTSSTGCAVLPSGYARVAALRSWITANAGV